MGFDVASLAMRELPGFSERFSRRGEGDVATHAALDGPLSSADRSWSPAGRSWSPADRSRACGPILELRGPILELRRPILEPRVMAQFL